MRGRFITLEGAEGAGKSTQVQRLAVRLRRLAIGVVVTQEPGGSAGADIMRHVLLSGVAKPLGPVAETLLIAAGRDDHVRATIAPALDQGKWVICNRFVDATRVYQGELGTVDTKLIRSLERVTVSDTMPDLTLILDLPQGDAAADRRDTVRLAFEARLRRAFRDLAAAEPERCALIDAGRSENVIADDIWSIVNARLDPAAAPISFEDIDA